MTMSGSHQQEKKKQQTIIKMFGMKIVGCVHQFVDLSTFHVTYTHTHVQNHICYQQWNVIVQDLKTT